MDKFSYSQVRDLATNIIEDCQPPRGDGVGGYDDIGMGIGWTVKVRGVKETNGSDVAGNGGVFFDTLAIPSVGAPSQLDNPLDTAVQNVATA